MEFEEDTFETNESGDESEEEASGEESPVDFSNPEETSTIIGEDEFADKLSDTEIKDDDGKMEVTIISADSGFETNESFEEDTLIEEVIKTVQKEDPDYYDAVYDDDEIIDRNLTLKEAGFTSEEGAKIKIKEREISVDVKSVSGSAPIKVTTRRSESVYNFKRSLSKILNTGPEQISLLYKHESLNNTRTIGSYDIREDSQLYLVYRFYGGN